MAAIGTNHNLCLIDQGNITETMSQSFQSAQLVYRGGLM